LVFISSHKLTNVAHKSYIQMKLNISIFIHLRLRWRLGHDTSSLSLSKIRRRLIGSKMSHYSGGGG
jgi:hypothetical protein